MPSYARAGLGPGWRGRNSIQVSHTGGGDSKVFQPSPGAVVGRSWNQELGIKPSTLIQDAAIPTWVFTTRAKACPCTEVFGVILVIALLRCKSHSIQITHLEHTVPWQEPRTTRNAASSRRSFHSGHECLITSPHLSFLGWLNSSYCGRCAQMVDRDTPGIPKSSH